MFGLQKKNPQKSVPPSVKSKMHRHFRMRNVSQIKHNVCGGGFAKLALMSWLGSGLSACSAVSGWRLSPVRTESSPLGRALLGLPDTAVTCDIRAHSILHCCNWISV